MTEEVQHQEINLLQGLDHFSHGAGVSEDGDVHHHPQRAPEKAVFFITVLLVVLFSSLTPKQYQLQV